MQSNKRTVDFAGIIAPHPATKRWPSLDAYGIKFQIAVYQNGHEDIIAEGGEPYSDKLEKLGFARINDEWVLRDAALSPREVLRVLPKMVMDSETLASKVFIDRTDRMPPAPPAPKVADVKATVQDRLKTRIGAAVDFNSLVAPRSASQRWMNLEAYGLDAKIAIYKDGSDAAFIKGGDQYADKLKDIGFVKIDGEWTIPLVRLQPRAVLRNFPEMKMEMEMPAEKIFVDRTNLAAPDLHLSEAEEHITSHLNSNPPRF